MQSIFRIPSDDMAGDAGRRVPLHNYTRRKTMNVGVYLFGSLAVFLLTGMPIAFAVGLAVAFAIIAWGEAPLIMNFQQMYNGIDSFTLIALPMFI